MKNTYIVLAISGLLLCAAFQGAIAQGYNLPLTMQGLDHTTNPSVASRALGGTTIGLRNDASVMFTNPAALQTLESVQFSIGGVQQYRSNDQSQIWYPSTNYSMLSLLMTGITRGLPDPDSAHLAQQAAQGPLNAGDSVPRPFDAIGSDWQHSRNEGLPLQFFAAAPFKINGVKFAVGLGAVEYANLNRYYENNNVLSPDIGSYRTALYYRPIDDSANNAVNVLWSQTISNRAGSIYGYGGALSASVRGKISLGLSGMIIRGTTYDKDYTLGRGRLDMRRTYFGLYPYSYYFSQIGTSDYSGYEFTFSGIYRTQSVSVGLAVKPPATITRDYTATLHIDSAGSFLDSRDVKGNDKMELPWRGVIGIGVVLRPEVTIDVEYEYLPYSAATYSSAAGSLRPWLDGSSFRAGIEYLPNSWLTLRGGYHTVKEVFETEGNYIQGDPVASTVYSGGVGLKIAGARLDITYEYQRIRYEDKWATNSNVNAETIQNIVASVTYELSWVRIGK
jgi:hypothetical protein